VGENVDGPREVEVTVVGEVNRGGLVACRGIVDAESSASVSVIRTVA